MNAPDPQPELAPELAALPRLPLDADGPVFAEPWEAQAFAMAVHLHQAGAFTWTEWAAALSDQLASDPHDHAPYYEHWLRTLEGLVTARGLADGDALHRTRDAWADAYRRTPHGKPVAL